MWKKKEKKNQRPANSKGTRGVNQAGRKCVETKKKKEEKKKKWNKIKDQLIHREQKGVDEVGRVKQRHPRIYSKEYIQKIIFKRIYSKEIFKTQEYIQNQRIHRKEKGVNVSGRRKKKEKKSQTSLFIGNKKA